MACLGSFGVGLNALRDALVHPVKSFFADGRAASADTSRLKDIFPAKSLRHMDHFTRMGLYAAANALKDSGLKMEDCRERTGIVMATGYGPAAMTFDFLDSILVNGEGMASPLSFSTSVQNIPAASIAMRLGLIGPCATVCQLDCPVTYALQLTWCWLEEERVDRVLLGAVDEHTPVLAAISGRIAGERASRQGIRAGLPLAEGAAFFCIERSTEQGRHRGFLEILTDDPPQGDFIEESGQRRLFCSGKVPLSFFAAKPQSHVGERTYGNLPVAQAFDIILALNSASPHCVCLNFGEHGTIGTIQVDCI
jgi:3-oxoacyl-[acyl-carrier-protein] synthase II